MITQQATAQEIFTSQFELQFSVSPNQAIAEFRTEIDPYNTFDEYKNEFVIDADTAVEVEEEFQQWKLQAQSALDDYQLTLMEKHSDRDVWAELDTTPAKADSLNNYRQSPQAFAIDTQFADGHITSRDIWDRTSGYHQSTTILTEYGIFNTHTTNRAHAAWLRVRKTERGGVEWISIGAIQINTYTGEFYCGAHRCKFANQLVAPTKDNKEKQEYQILALLQHLGSHQPKGDNAYPYLPIKHIKAYHDGDSVKLDSHIARCTNTACKARHQQIINGTIEMEK